MTESFGLSMTNADDIDMSVLDMETVICIKDAHISELRHALQHVISCFHSCEQCRRIAQTAIKHETWWDHIDVDSSSQRAQEIARSAEEHWHNHQ